jgi:hypothetical protein
MLHAFSHKKSGLHRRYLGHREDTSEKRVAEEDEISSLLMGPLAFLSPAAIAAFWRALIDLRHPEHKLPARAPDRAEMHFWPRRNRIEPDLVVDLRWGNDVRILLVEFKWRAPLSGENQLHNQWEHYLTPEQRKHALHFFIGLDTSEGINALNRNDVWKGRLLMRSWFDVLTAVSTIQSGAGLELHRWREQVQRFLKLVEVQPFSGFKPIKLPLIPVQTSTVFFKP